ncbi:hypothetical protein [Streptomyces mirabilis]
MTLATDHHLTAPLGTIDIAAGLREKFGRGLARGPPEKRWRLRLFRRRR